MSHLFSPAFIQAHQYVGQGFDIETFAALVDPEVVGLKSKADFYAPVRFQIRMCDKHAGGSIRLDIPVHQNANWVDTLHSAVRGMLSLPPQAKIELKDYKGRLVSTSSSLDLTRLGDLDLYVNGELKVTRTLPSVPMEFSITKMASLGAWYKDNIVRTLPEKIAQVLVNKDLSALHTAIQGGGLVEKTIQSHIKSSVANWNEFARVHHVAALPHEPSARVARNILHFVREYIRAANVMVGEYIAANQAKAIAARVGAGADYFAPVITSDVKASDINGFDMYNKLMEDMVVNPSLQRGVLSLVHNGDTEQVSCNTAPSSQATPPPTEVQEDEPETINCGMDGKKKSKKKHVVERVEAVSFVQHPLFAHLHHTVRHVGVEDKFPVYYELGHTRQNMTPTAEYKGGERDKAYTYYNLYVGNHVVPPGLKVRKVKEKVSEPKLVARKLVPLVGTEAPKLVPLKKEAPKLVPLVGTEAPKLVPLKKEAPKLVPLVGTEAPKLVPLKFAGRAPKLVPLQKEAPKLVPISEDEDDGWVDTLPQVK